MVLADYRRDDSLKLKYTCEGRGDNMLDRMCSSDPL